MLVLTRKSGETITIGDEIEVTVLEVKGDQIKLGIQAPKSIEIHRKEVFEIIKEENKRAIDNIDNLKQIFLKKE